MNIALTTRQPRPYTLAPLTWAFSLMAAAAALLVIVFVNLNRPAPLFATTPAVIQNAPPVSLVIAVQDIPAGTIITDAMVGIVTLSQADMEKLEAIQPDHTFITDPQEVIGGISAVDIHWFQPFDTALMTSDTVSPCESASGLCVTLPEGYSTIGLPRRVDTVQGLSIGNRVDVLAVVEDQVRMIVANVLLTDISDEWVTFAAPSWQVVTLIPYSNSGTPYALRLHTGATPQPLSSDPIEYVLTSHEPLPENYVFDLIVNVPAAQGYLLTALPTSIDAIPFTSNGDTLHFWFKNIEVVSITNNGRTITMRMPEADAANLDFLIKRNMELTFVPDAGD